MAGIDEYLDAYGFRRHFLREQLVWLNEERDEYEAEARRLHNELVRVRREIAGYLIPEVGDEFIGQLEQHLSFYGLMSIKLDYEQQFKDAEERRIELEAMDEIQNFDQRIGIANQSIEELQPEYDQTQKDIGIWYDSKWFKSLNKRNYFASDYQAGIFRRFFDWRAVSFLMAELPKTANLTFENPTDLKSHFNKLYAKANKIYAEFEKRTGERDRIADLKVEYDNTVTAPERLLGELYQELGNATIQHLNECPEAVRLELASQDRNLNAFLQKETGLRKQIQYLRELSVSRIDSRIQQSDQELHKADQKIRKLEMQRRVGKRKYYSDEDIARVRNVKAEKWEKRRLKTAKLRQKIGQFRKYDRGSWAEDYLWWDLITNASTADDIFEVREHRRKHPGWDYRTYRDPFDADDDIVEASALDDAAADLASSMAADNADDFFDPS